MIFCSFERCGEGVDLLSCFEFRVEPSIKKKFRVEPCHSVALYSVCLVYLLTQVFSHWISDFKKNRTMLFCNSAPLSENLQTFICNYVKAFFLGSFISLVQWALAQIVPLAVRTGWTVWLCVQDQSEVCYLSVKYQLSARNFLGNYVTVCQLS